MKIPNILSDGANRLSPIILFTGLLTASVLLGLQSIFGSMLSWDPFRLTDAIPGDLGDARLVNLILEHGSHSVHIDAMWASLDTNLPTLNGYSGSTPQNWLLEPDKPEEELRAAVMDWWKNKNGGVKPICLLTERAMPASFSSVVL